MKRQALMVLSVALVGGCSTPNTAAKQGPVQPAELSGCWRVTVGTFKGSPVDSGMTHLPAIIQLDTLPGKGIAGERTGWLVRSLAVDNPWYQDGYFAVAGKDSVTINWSNGYVGLSIQAVVASDDMQGTARAWTDYGGEQHAPITLHRVACP